jgi:hypothetical protein
MPADDPLFISDEQITAFVDVNGRIHVYRGAGIIGTNRLEGTERAAALDAVRRAVDADYATEVARLPHAHPFVPGREVYEVCETCTFDRSHRWHDPPPTAIDPPFICEACGRHIGEHTGWHGPPPPGATEGRFPRPTSGFYCPSVDVDGPTPPLRCVACDQPCWATLRGRCWRCTRHPTGRATGE